MTGSSAMNNRRKYKSKSTQGYLNIASVKSRHNSLESQTKGHYLSNHRETDFFSLETPPSQMMKYMAIDM